MTTYFLITRLWILVYLGHFSEWWKEIPDNEIFFALYLETTLLEQGWSKYHYLIFVTLKTNNVEKKLSVAILNVCLFFSFILKYNIIT